MASTTALLNKLFTTALPNGFNGQNLRLTALLTPALASGALAGTAFECWPANAAQLSWWVIFNEDQRNPVSASVVSETLGQTQQEIWAALFDSVNTVGHRTGLLDSPQNATANATDANRPYAKRPWIVTHDAATLQEMQDSFRLDQFYSQYFELRNDTLRTLSKELVTDLGQRYKAVNLYLHPIVQDQTGTVDAQALVSDRNDARTYWKNNAPLSNLLPADAELVQHRVEHCTDRLELDEGERLLNIGLYAVYRHCAKSAFHTGKELEADPHINDTLDQLVQSITAQATGTAAATATVPKQAALDGAALDQAQRYAEFLLFYRRRPRTTDPGCAPTTLTAPDFHQLLGLLNRYPAILRPLGIAIDLEVAPPSGVTVNTVSVTCLDPATTCNAVTFPQSGPPKCSTVPLDGTGSTDGRTVVVARSATYCVIQSSPPDFYSQSHYNLPAKGATASDDLKLLHKRYLWVGAKSNNNVPLFKLISEDTDGTTHKISQGSTARSRGSEYQTTAMQEPGVTAPAARTAGISLLHRNRDKRMAAAVADSPDPDSVDLSKPLLYYADDLILGYRVDVRYKDSWFSVCARKGSYEIFPAKSKPKISPWKPAPGLELAADEGFVTLGATTSETGASDRPRTQVQAHQSLFTWSGWSMAVPPVFDPFNSVNPTPPDPQDANVFLKLRPTYELDCLLPPLRFGQDYGFRCRVVDLAGNSVAADSKPDSSELSEMVLEHTMCRHEPVRGPQILLSAPIHRKWHPGEHVDRVVIRDSDGSSARTLVPPRETLRMAELHGQLTSADLPPSAFPHISLDADGSFPNVLAAYNLGWYSPEEGDLPTSDSASNPPPELLDAIFHYDEKVARPLCPYYPDPLATYICVQPTDVADDPAQSISLPCQSVDLYPSNRTDGWPNCEPTRIRLVAAGKNQPASVTPKLMSIDDDYMPTRVVWGFIVALPEAHTLTLDISSASCDKARSKKLPAGNNVALLCLYQNHRATILDSGPGTAATSVAQGPVLVSSIHTAEKQQGIRSSIDLAVMELPEITAADILDGTNGSQTPSHRMTFVHAVRKPLGPATFGSDFQIQREVGQAAASISGTIVADWLSTGKVTCFASWKDCVDDLKKDEPSFVESKEEAFHLDATPVANRDAGKQKHVFRDTRAHTVTYHLTSSTRFRNYYPEDEKAESFVLSGGTLDLCIIKNSIRPPAPKIAYIIPAFHWVDDYDKPSNTRRRGRVVALRVYIERPCKGTGNEEGLGVVFAAESADRSAEPFLSRIGSDPIWYNNTDIPGSELTAPVLPGGTLEENCYLAEGGQVNVMGYPLQYAHDRKLWFCDLTFDIPTVYFPFLRLGLVRWQPQSLVGADSVSETRISPVVLSDFMQIAPNRWAHVQRTGRDITVTISGVTYDRGTSNPTSFALTVQARWHAIGRDMGWRPVDCGANFTPYEKDSVTTWTAKFTLPHSPSTHKYRLMLEEFEWITSDASTTTASKDTQDSSRLVYADFFEL